MSNAGLARYAKSIIERLNDEEKAQLVSDLLIAVPDSIVDKIGLALMADYTEAAIERFQAFGSIQGIPTGFASLDRLTKGFVAGELVVIAGKTSHGKTLLSINITNNIAARGHSVLFVTLEMTKEEVTSRFMYINGGNTPEYEDVAARVVFQLNDELSWKHIDRLMQAAKEDMAVDLVVIDHLHYFTREVENLAEDLGRITKEFKKNAIRHKLPVILVSHVRKGQIGKGTEVTMDDLRGSSYIAQDADIVMMVMRNQNDSKQLKVRVEKNRNRGVNFDANEALFVIDGVKMDEA